MIPRLDRLERDGVTVWTDVVLAERGIRIAFTERGGGVSRPPYASLDLAAHVGDVSTAVDENRRRLLRALDLETCAERLTLAEQVHGSEVAVVDERLAGCGASARRGRGPVPGADALVTGCPRTPLLLLYADCVPVVLVAERPQPAIAVIHAGWRGALARLPGHTVPIVAAQAGCAPEEVTAYVGPHVLACHYEVDEERMSHFTSTFATLAGASGGLDLGLAVTESLCDAGIPMERQCRLDVCTADTTDRFYSFRAEGQTGRHGALAAILGATQ